MTHNGDPSGSGDWPRFEQLVLPHLDAAYNLARWLARNDADAQDVTQEAALRAFRYFDGFRGGDVDTYLTAAESATTRHTLGVNHRSDAPLVRSLGVLLGGSLLAMLLSSVLIIPLAMAMWFAPALVFFNNMAPLDALKASFNACLKNTLPFLILGLIVLVLMFFAALPVGLGFLVLFPVLAGTLYASYQDVFVAH